MTPTAVVRRLGRIVTLGAVFAVVGIGGEALYTANREYLPAGSAPAVSGTFPAPGGRRPIRLLLLGDSTAAGVGASLTATTLGGRIAAALAAARGQPVVLASAAVSGARVTDLDAELHEGLRAGQPDVALIVVGANDATHLTRLQPLQAELTRAIGRLGDAGVRVVVAGCPDLGAARAFPQPLRLIAAARGRAVAAREKAAARDAGASYVDLGAKTGPAFRADPRMLSRDRFHPSDAGYALWAQALLPAVVAALAGKAG